VLEALRATEFWKHQQTAINESTRPTFSESTSICRPKRTTCALSCALTEQQEADSKHQKHVKRAANLFAGVE
jgi:hypothetical protein